MADGWIKLHRKLLDNPLWCCEPFTRGQAWVDLILLANHEYGFFYKRGVKIELQRGQCGVSEVGLSERWKWSRTKVKKFINDLEKEQQIIHQQNNVTQIVTIVKYDEYQTKEQQTIQQKDSKSAAEVQQKSINKNNKEELEEKNDKEYKKTLLSEIEISDFPNLNYEYIKIAKSFLLLFRSNLKDAGASTKTLEKAKGTWIDDIRLLIEEDGYSIDDLREVHGFLSRCAFWKKNIISTSKLREKFVTLKLEIQNERTTNQAGNHRPASKGNDANDRRASVENLKQLSIAILQQPSSENV